MQKNFQKKFNSIFIFFENLSPNKAKILDLCEKLMCAKQCKH